MAQSYEASSKLEKIYKASCLVGGPICKTIIYNPDLKLEEKHVVVKTTFSSNNEDFVGRRITTEKPYNLTDKKERKALLNIMANAMSDDMDELVKEVKEVIEEIKDELPF